MEFELEDARVLVGDVHWICKILIGSAEVVSNRERLFGAMHLPFGQLQDVLRIVNINGGGSYEFFTRSINQWISLNGQGATLRELIYILRSEGFYRTADDIIQEWNTTEASRTRPRRLVGLPTQTSKSKGTRTKSHRDIIAENLIEICDLTNLSSRLLDTCVQDHVLTRDENEQIVRHHITYERTREFYIAIRRKDADSFARLLKIFEHEDTCQSSDLLRILKPVEPFSAATHSSDSGSITLFEASAGPPDIMRAEDELIYLDKMIRRQETTGRSGLVLNALIGQSGMGKTALVRKYVEKFSQHFESVVWIDAESSSSINSAFRRLLSSFKEIQTSLEVEQVFVESYEYFRHRKTLFIFDNVADFVSLNNFLPNNIGFTKMCSILLISRNPNLKKSVKSAIELQPLSVSASVDYMQKKLNIFSHEDLELVKRLVANLNCLPSEIDQMTKLLRTAAPGSLSDFLENYVLTLERTKSGVWFEVADPPVNFTGREDELKKLHELIINCNSRNGLVNVVPKLSAAAIGGLGGIGKTSFVRKYAWDYGAEYFNGNVVWINAESRDSIEASFYRLAFKLNILTELGQVGNENIQNVIELVYDFFKDRKCLFIFDNVENFCGTDSSVDKFLPLNRPPSHKRPYILMTSRKRNLPLQMHIKSIELDLLSKDQSISYLRKQLSLPDGEETERLATLADLLQYLPLALQQAVFYIQKLQRTFGVGRRCENPLQKYLELFTINAKKVLSKNYPGFSTGFEKSVMITWSVTFEKIKEDKYGNLASEIIKTVSYFDPDNIDVEMLTCAMPENKVRKSINLLSDYSMVDVKAGSINVHRLVQQVIRMQEKEANHEIEVIRKALSLTEHYTFEYVLHRASIWNYALEYDELAQQFSEYGIQICARLNLEDEVQFKIFERTDQKLQLIFEEDNSIKRRLFLCRFLNDLRSKNRNLEDIYHVCVTELRMDYEELTAEDDSLFDILKTMEIPNALINCAVESSCSKLLEGVAQKFKLYVRHFTALGNPSEVLYCAQIIIKCLMKLNMEANIAEFTRNVNMEWVTAYGWENSNSISVANGLNEVLLGYRIS